MLVTVVMLLLLFSVLGMSLLALTMNSVTQSSGEVKSQSAYYIAESGATLKLKEIEQTATALSADKSLNKAAFLSKFEQTVLTKRNAAHQLVPQRFTQFESQRGEQPEAEVSVQLVNMNLETGVYEYQIVSKGIIGNRHRTVSKPLLLSYTEGKGFVMPKNLGVYAKNQMVITNGTINGNIIMDTLTPQVLEISGNPTINGKVYVPTESTGKVFKYSSGQQWWFDSKAPIVEKQGLIQEMKMPPFPQPFPNYPMIADKLMTSGKNTHYVIKDGNININSSVAPSVTMMLTQNVQAKNITFASDYQLTLDVGNRDIALVVDRISGQGQLDVVSKDGGSLTLYVRDNIDIKNHLNKSQGKDVFIYLGPSADQLKPKTFVSSSYAEFNASLYAYDANLELVGSAAFTGQFLTGGKSVKVQGNTKATSADTTVVYAPKATVELTGSGKLFGAVVADVFKLNGGASVHSSEVDLGEGPFFEETSKESNVSVESGTTLEQ